MQLLAILGLLVVKLSLVHNVYAFEPCLSGWTKLEANDICYYIENTARATLFGARDACEAFPAPNSKLLLEEHALDVFADVNDPTIDGRFRIEGYQRNIPTGTWNWYEDNPNSQPLVPQQNVRQTRDTFATLLIRLRDGVYFGNRKRTQEDFYICQSDCFVTTFLPTTLPPTTIPPTTIPPTTIPPTTIPPTTIPPTTIPPTTIPPTTIPPTTIPPTTIPPTTIPPTTIPPTTIPPTTIPPTTIPPTTILPTTIPPTTVKPTTVPPTVPTTALPTAPTITCMDCLPGWSYLAGRGICYYIETTLTASLFDARTACEGFSAPDSKLLLEENAIDLYADLDDPASIGGRYRIEGYQRDDPPWNWYQVIDGTPTSLTPGQTVINVLSSFATLLLRMSDGQYYGNKNRNDEVGYICQSSPDCTETTLIETTIPETTVIPTTVPPTTIPPTTIPATTIPPTTIPPTTIPPTTIPPTTIPPTTVPPTTITLTTIPPTTILPTTIPPTTVKPTTVPPTVPATALQTAPTMACMDCLPGWSYLASRGICYYIETTLTASLFDARTACEGFSATADSKLLLEENAIDLYADLDDPASIGGRYRIEGYQRDDPPWNWYQNVDGTTTSLTPAQTVNSVLSSFATLLLRMSDGQYYGNKNRNDELGYICQSSPECVETTLPPTTAAPTTTAPTVAPTTTAPTGNTGEPATTTPAATEKPYTVPVPDATTTTPAPTTTPPATVGAARRSNTLLR